MVNASHASYAGTKTQFIKRDATGAGFLNSLANKLPFEMHLPGHNFTGPGTKLYKRLNPDGTPKEWSIPINRVNNAADHHDLCYSKHDDTTTRNEVCDKTVLCELNGIVDPTLRERIDKSIVGKLIKAKVNFGLCHPIKKKLKFTNELAEKLYKSVTRKFQRRRFNVNSFDEIWAAELIDMQALSKDNNGIKYLLTVIDIFSKFVWIVPLKRQTGQDVANAFSSILKERRPSKTWVDRRWEFYNKDVQKLVELYSTENEEKSCVI